MTNRDAPKDVRIRERAEHDIYLATGYLLVLAMRRLRARKFVA